MASESDNSAAVAGSGEAPETNNSGSVAGAGARAGDADKVPSKKQSKKEVQEAAAVSPDPLSTNYGDLPLQYIQSKAPSNRKLTRVGDLVPCLSNETVFLRSRIHTVRAVGKKMAFLVLRDSMTTVQCVLTVDKEHISAQMVTFARNLSKESIVDVDGVVSVPETPIKTTTQRVEVQVRKLYCVNRAVLPLPINIEDAARSKNEFEKAELTGEKLVRVNQDTRLNNRVLDLRTPANQAIFRVQSHVGNQFRQFLCSEGFIEIHTPKLIHGSSEGGAAVFKLDYKGQPACLAQSPQLHKQMAICGDLKRVFEVGPVFRAEDSYTHRHLCEFVGLDVEMEIQQHYFEVMDIVDQLFVSVFEHLNTNCKDELAAINRQYPFEPLKFLPKTLRLTFAEGVQMLMDAGVEVDPLGDLNTDAERKLGKLVFEKYGTEFYILHRYPLGIRPFYTMPCYDDPVYSNSFDVFIRGEEIISGAQRVHLPELLTSRAKECKIDVNTISAYIDSFRYGSPPHGGFGVGLERVVMLFCALDNIRKTSMFPRDPKRLSP